jgi:hypothetical protein
MRMRMMMVIRPAGPVWLRRACLFNHILHLYEGQVEEI